MSNSSETDTLAALEAQLSLLDQLLVGGADTQACLENRLKVLDVLAESREANDTRLQATS